MIIGWDISTSIIGISFFNDDNSFLESEFLDLRKIKDHLDKANYIENYIKSLKLRFKKEKKIISFIEEPLSGFSVGKSMQNTIVKLHSINFLCTWLIHKHLGKTITHIHPSTVKKIVGLKVNKGCDKKKVTLEFVKLIEPKWKIHLNKNENPHPWNYDCADSYLVAKAGIILSKNE